MKIDIEIPDSAIVKILESDLESLCKWQNYSDEGDEVIRQALLTVIAYYSPTSS